MEQRTSAVKKGDIVTLAIEGISHEGKGVGRLEGMAVFVEKALPGEQVRVCIDQKKKQFATAHVVAVEQASSARVTEDCLHATRCGGCTFRHAAYEEELRLKQSIVQQAMQRIGKLQCEVPLPLAAENENGYRNRAVFHISHNGAMGFFEEKSHSICPVGQCMLLHPCLQKFYEVLKKHLRQETALFASLRELVVRCNAAADAILLTLVADEKITVPQRLLAALRKAEPKLHAIWLNYGSAVYSIYGSGWTHLSGAETLPEMIGDVRLHLAPASFSQVNHAQMMKLYAQAKAYAALDGTQTVLDLYSGVGSIALYLAKDAKQVTGVESYPPAVENAMRNAQENGVENCRFLCGDAADVLQLTRDALPVPPDVVVLDPPRSGCDAAVLQAVLAWLPARVVYVSCDPATLARDCRILAEGGYALQRVQPVDMFPRTQHVETVCLLSRKDK